MPEYKQAVPAILEDQKYYDLRNALNSYHEETAVKFTELRQNKCFFVKNLDKYLSDMNDFASTEKETW